MRKREGKKAYVKHSVKRALTFTGAGGLLALEGGEITFLGRFADRSIFGRFGVSATLEDEAREMPCRASGATGRRPAGQIAPMHHGRCLPQWTRPYAKRKEVAM